MQLVMLFLLWTAAAAGAEPMRLFNGTNLHGFTTWLVDDRGSDSRGVFTATNGMIRISGDGLGYLATREQFTNYHLSLQFRWGRTNTKWGSRIGKARDSGVFLHATGPDGNSHDGEGAFMAAIECNIFQGATGDFLLIRGHGAGGKLIAPRITARAKAAKDQDGWFTHDPAGEPITIERWGRLNWIKKDAGWRDEEDFRGANDLERATGEWNKLECLCHGREITIILNGTRVNHAFNVWPSSGKILLQCEGSEIYFRDVVLRRLSEHDQISVE